MNRNAACIFGLRRSVAGWLAAAAGTLALAGCGGGARQGPEGRLSDPSRPVQLSGRQAETQPQPTTAAVPFDDALVRQAIERYRINKKRAGGPMIVAGADLNRDGLEEAVVLFQGEDWCARTGCSLAVFQKEARGYRVVSRSVRVKAPVVVAREQTNGWHDLLVTTGGGPAPVRRVRLRFGANGYTRNAMLEPEIPPDVPQFGDTVIQEPVPSAGTQGSRASNP